MHKITEKTFKIISNLRYIPRIVFSIKNWPAFCLHYAGALKSNNNIYLFRNGVKIATNGNIDVSTIAVIWIKKNYGKMPANATIVDIGANIGAFSVYAACSGDNNQVYSYEPMPENYELLVRNIKINNMEKRIRAFNLGISSQKERAMLYLNDSLSHSICCWKEGKPSVEISCISLEDIFTSNSLKSIDILKIDCEGAEYAILFGASSACFKRIKEIRMEYHNIDGRNKADELIRFLQEQGKKVVLLRERNEYCGDLWMK
jgi:FkbM family methyltransferase